MDAQNGFDEMEWALKELAEPADLTPDLYPQLGSISAAFFYQCLPHPQAPASPPEYVYVPSPDPDLRTWGALAMWNLAWEAGVERNELFIRRLPKPLRRIGKYPDVDFRLVPWTGQSRYPAFIPLYHLLPATRLRRFGLPTLKRGVWPVMHPRPAESLLPPDFEARLSRALAYHLWPLLAPGSGPSAFSANEPIRLLAHSLDFWLPYIDLVIQSRLRQLGPVKVENDDQSTAIRRLQTLSPPGVTVSRPLYGGTLWLGEEEAWSATRDLVEAADRHGRLRAIIEAVRAHRVQDDFSPRWSFAREDFERRLYRKRSRTKVTFVELSDTIPVHGPNAEAEDNLLWQDFFALLTPKEHRIVVCLRSGFTKAAEIARELGYANHSPVSKALRCIQQKALRYLDEGT